MSPADLLAGLAGRLAAAGLDEAELYVKRGRSRRIELGAHGAVAVASEEEGWALRAGGRSGSFFLAGSGAFDPAASWPAAGQRPLRLPAAEAPPDWRPPGDLDSPLLGESEGRALLEGVERELAGEVRGGRLLAGVLEDGASEEELASTRGVTATVRRRAASLRLEAAGAATESAHLFLAAREARRFAPGALARRLADRLVLAARGRPPERDRGDFLLAPEVALALLESLLPLLVGPGAQARAAAYRDRRGRIGSAQLTIVDDGRLPGGLFEAPVDGEGVATGRAVLVEGGVFRQGLLAWWQATTGRTRPSGCCRRASWRDLPRPAPTHLYIEPKAGASVAQLLSGLARGYYLIDVEGAPRIDLDDDRFALPVCGFAVEKGSARQPVTGGWLCGGVGAFFKGIQATGRDLRFLPRTGMLGAPSLLVSGLEIRSAPERGAR